MYSINGNQLEDACVAFMSVCLSTMTVLIQLDTIILLSLSSISNNNIDAPSSYILFKMKHLCTKFSNYLQFIYYNLLFMHRSYMFNCQSNEERYQWMTKTSSAIPSNDTATAAPQKEKDEKKEEETNSKGTDIPTPSTVSSSRERHETVDEAALLAVSDIHEEGKIHISIPLFGH